MSIRAFFRLFATVFAAGWGAAGITPTDATAAPTLTLARAEDAARFRVTTFATELAFPTSMAALSDGSLLVATSDGASLWG